MQLGVVAAGHHLTADAGAQMLRAGGNAFDAAVAAAFCGCVVEPTLSGLGGGGFATYHDAASGDSATLDFFAAVPGIGLDRVGQPMQEIEVFYGVEPQLYHIGPASVPVPGTALGLLELHRTLGTLPLRHVLTPAWRAAVSGFVVSELNWYNLDFVHQILMNTPEGRAIFAPKGHVPSIGDRLVQRDLARTLERIMAGGERELRKGRTAQQMVMWSERRGGLLTADDLVSYEVKLREPVRVQFAGAEIVTAPPPSSGGVLTAFALSLAERLGVQDLDTPDGARRLVAALDRSSQLRGPEFDRLLYGGDLAARVLDERYVGQAAKQLRLLLDHPSSPTTTQMSVIDAAGNAVSITTSTGTGSGEIADGTGIELSNMLGESDLRPADHQLLPGERLTSMMSPLLALVDGKVALATGSAGSTRIRSALVQTTIRALAALGSDDLAAGLDAAVQAPRLHREGDVLHLEGGFDDELARHFAGAGERFQRWDEQHLYFGGVNAAASWNGAMAGAGDARRGGAAVVVSG